mgnify:CR=1 FL=1
MPKVKPFIVGKVRYLSLKEFTQQIGYTIRWVYHLLYAGEIEGIQRGAIWYFHPDEVDKFIARSTDRRAKEREGRKNAIAEHV